MGHVNFFLVNKLCYQMDLFCYLLEGLLREKVSAKRKTPLATSLHSQMVSSLYRLKCQPIPQPPIKSLKSLTTFDHQTTTNNYEPTFILLCLLLLSRLSLSPPRPTTPSRPKGRQIPPVTSRTDDVQGACVIRMYISVTYSAWK